MTKFWRSNFLRTSASGNTHEVIGHWVDRDDWDRSELNDQDTQEVNAFFGRHRIGSSVTSLFMNPNAVCPVCGTSVFFYQNNLGSRVYFDELGPPWPKHPCTDTSSDNVIGRNQIFFTQIQPRLRNLDEWKAVQKDLEDLPRSEREAIQADIANLPRNLKRDFWEKYKTSKWNSYEVSARLNLKQGHVLVLTQIESQPAKKLYVSAKRFPKALSVRDVVFEYKNWLSFFDISSFAEKEIETEKLRTANVIVERIVTSQMLKKDALKSSALVS